MVLGDGNTVLRRSARSMDTAIFPSKYFLPREMADEMKKPNKAGVCLATIPLASQLIHMKEFLSLAHSAAPTERNELEVDPETDAEAASILRQCTSNWKAAQSDNRKHQLDTFDETGIFPAICRHGAILAVADMVQSGEL